MGRPGSEEDEAEVVDPVASAFEREEGFAVVVPGDGACSRKLTCGKIDR